MRTEYTYDSLNPLPGRRSGEDPRKGRQNTTTIWWATFLVIHRSAGSFYDTTQTYDKVYRLATTTRNTGTPSAPGPKFYVTYGYDLAGNLTLQTDPRSTSIFTTFYLRRGDNRADLDDRCGCGVTAMKYDQVGKPDCQGGSARRWRPQQHEFGTQYVYDGLNRLIAKTDPTGAVGGTTLYT